MKMQRRLTPSQVSELIMNNVNDESENASRIGSYEEVESEALLNRNLHPHRVVIEHIPVFHCHTAAVHTVPLKKRMVNRIGLIDSQQPHGVHYPLGLDTA
jgi:hypothetical protein